MPESEVAQLLQRIEAEYQAAASGLKGLAITAKHAFITARMENIQRCQERLIPLVGSEQEATRLVNEVMATTETPTNCDPPTLLQIRAAKGFAIEELAQLAELTPEDVYYLEAGCPYEQACVERVLLALSKLTGEHYTLENVRGVYVKTQP
jgi:hypothetical protein